MQPEIVQTHPYIDRWRVHGFQYYVIPKAMLKEAPFYGLGMDEVVLYSVLRDRANLSGKNKWVNAKGQVYIIFPRAEAASYMGWSQRKTIDAFARLVEAGLLTEEVQERKNGAMNKPKLLYVRQWAESSIVHSVEELKNGGFPFLTLANVYVDTGTYFILPRCLFESELYKGLSLRAIMLYIIALDKLNLSINCGQIDDTGFVWCHLETQQVCKTLGCCDRSLREAYKELESIGLMVRKRNGGDPKIPYRIYLRDYLPQPGGVPAFSASQGAENTERQKLNQVPENPAPSVGNIYTRERQDLHPDGENSTCGSRQNLQPSYPFSQPSLSTLSLVNIADKPADAPFRERNERMSFDTAYGQYQEQLLYPHLCDDINAAARPWAKETMYRLLDQSIEIMAKDSATPGLYIRIGSETIKKQYAEECYKGIDRYIMYTLLEKVSERIESIKNHELYLHKALLSAVSDHEGEAYYTKRKIEQERTHMSRAQSGTN